MKSKYRGYIRMFLIFAVSIFACFGLFLFVDYASYGFLLDWLETQLTMRIYIRDGAFINVPDWDKVKSLILFFTVFNCVVLLAVIFITTSVCRKRTKKKTINRAAQMMSAYMQQDVNADEIFPDQYAEISAQMAEVKSTMLQNQQRLNEEAARKNDLIAYLAHDLKTPLTSVIGYLSLLDEVKDMPEAQRSRYINISFEKALRLEQLIDEFFDITRFNLHQIYLEKEEFDLSYMLIQMTDEFYPILKNHGNTISVQTGENLMIRADSSKLGRVFNNILKNAITYSYRNTPINVIAESTESEVKISFSNTGKTIPRQKLDEIFEKFFRLDSSRASNTGGAGLGLAIAKEIVMLHGGTIIAASENEQTTFIVILPK